MESCLEGQELRGHKGNLHNTESTVLHCNIVDGLSVLIKLLSKSSSKFLLVKIIQYITKTNTTAYSFTTSITYLKEKKRQKDIMKNMSYNYNDNNNSHTGLCKALSYKATPSGNEIAWVNLLH